MENFSLIITHYNQMKYIKEAILSVLNQNYKNIEIIVSDDHSKEFDKDKIEEIFKKYNILFIGITNKYRTKTFVKREKIYHK